MERKNNIQAIILAGGLGTRLKPIVGDCPKALIKVGSLFFIEYLFKQIEFCGISEVILAVGVGADQIRKVFGKKWNGLGLNYSMESSPRGTAGALRWACGSSSSEHVMAMNGDSYFDVDLNLASEWHFQKKAEATLLLTRTEDTSRFGNVFVDETGRI